MEKVNSFILRPFQEVNDLILRPFQDLEASENTRLSVCMT